MSTLKERFNTKYKIKENGCWEWIAGSRGVGYGCIREGKKIIDAHRVSWMLHKGDIPEGLMVCHKCDNRKCVNPEHLFLGTGSDNMKDCSNKKRLSSQNPETILKMKQRGTELYGIKVEDKFGNIFNSLSEVRDFYGWGSCNYIKQQLQGKRSNKYGFKLIDGGTGRHNTSKLLVDS